MGSDNLIEANIVTPMGEFLTVNACKHADLFWAIRGGGGGTYGVITSAVIKAFPTPQTTRWILQAQLLDKFKQGQWWDLMTYFQTLVPALKQEGFQGSYRLIGHPLTSTLTFTISFYLYDKLNGTVEASFKPFKKRLDEMVRAGSVAYSSNVFTEPSYLKAYDRVLNTEAVAHVNFVLVSRLIPVQLMEDAEVMARVLKEMRPSLENNDVSYFPSNIPQSSFIQTQTRPVGEKKNHRLKINKSINKTTGTVPSNTHRLLGCQLRQH